MLTGAERAVATGFVNGEGGMTADRGRPSSTTGSLAAFENSASAEIITPGVMAPPRYSPFAVTTSRVVAVPKSTMMAGPPNSRWTATAFTIRSAPTSKGS